MSITPELRARSPSCFPATSVACSAGSRAPARSVTRRPGRAVLAEIAAEAEQARGRARRRRLAVGAARSAIPSRCRSARRKDDIAGRHPRPPGRDRGRRDRLGQDHPAAQDLPRAGPGRARPDRAHPAAPDRRPHGRRAHRRGARHRPLGATVGYKVRFTDQVGDDTLVKVMTDGILLAEMQNDRMLRRYDTLIIDEAHERSLNIDFLLGYLKQLLPRRPDLKVIITSATIDTGALRRALRRRRRVGAGDRGLRPHLPGRGPLPAAGRLDHGRRRGRRRPRGADRPDRRHRRRRRRAGPRGRRATSWCSSPASGRSATPPTRWTARRPAQHRDPPALRPAVARPSSTGSSSRTPAAGSCWPPTSPRPR